MTKRVLWLLAGSAAVGLAGCASSPHSATQKTYDAYWQCASQAVRPYIARQDLSSREAAMRAQAQCNGSYQQYRSSQIATVRHTVARDSYDMADQLGAQQALVWRRRVTQTLTDYVQQLRTGG
ncbi:hypothetical protein V5738_03250 [Salinisphaera sp. SPP-AMP-43]|uniref:hypothetical protein n=1 Tax=Salinisphaera sp. SPP-AMP-43 TaxID=3121288 RepID=UPI003C6E255A